MKKYLLIILAVLYMFSLSSCSQIQPEEDNIYTEFTNEKYEKNEKITKDNFIQKSGKDFFLILPESKYRIKIEKEHEKYMDEIDFDSVVEVEKRLQKKIDDIESDKKGNYYYLDEANDKLWLYTKVVHSIDESQKDETHDYAQQIIGDVIT